VCDLPAVSGASVSVTGANGSDEGSRVADGNFNFVPKPFQLLTARSKAVR
jgi:hypothetical protein